jgi:XTP/dITP diphosphohydrolase
MKQIVFATGNAHKLEEARTILKDFNIVSLNHLGFNEEIPETADTLEGNALLKARFVARKYSVDCFSDDTGLEIAVLDGAPGVHSARFAGANKNPLDNMYKVLHLLENQQNRKAQFRTVIALIFNEKEYIFEGKTEGTIATEPHGSNGFGYDPVFIPNGYDKSFAQLATDIKNAISHRAMALKKMTEFLSNQ